jgi:ankyrin repeat protein
LLNNAVNNGAELDGRIKFLVENGASLENINQAGDSALIMAVKTSPEYRLSTIKYILGKSSTLINIGNQNGDTPLMTAVDPMVRDANAVSLLLNYGGADKNIRNRQGKTAYDIAKETKFTEALKIFDSSVLVP